jgi:dethiobiotin synthetase
MNIIVTGCGTGVGKTVTSAIITEALQAEYWKPIESGIDEESDTATISNLVPRPRSILPAYRFKAAYCPHHAARLENRTIHDEEIQRPLATSPLVIETAGGILVPCNKDKLLFDIFKKFEGVWVIVSHNYLGSINHTLLTLTFLQEQRRRIAGVVFNGPPNPDTEEAILHFSKVCCLGRILPERSITTATVQKYARMWGKELCQHIK